MAYPDILFYWGAESATAEKSGGDNTATLQSLAVIDAAYHPVGSGSLDCPTSYDRAEFTWTAGVLSKDEGRVGFYFYADTLVTNGGLFDCRYDASNRISLYLAAADNTKLTLVFIVAGAGASISTAAATIAATTLYFVEIAWKLSTDYREIFVNGVSKASSTAAVGDVWAGDPVLVKFGEWAGGASDIHLDQMLISNSSTRDLNAIKDLTSFPDTDAGNPWYAYAQQ